MNIKLKTLLFEDSSSERISTLLKSQIAPHLFSKRVYNADVMSDMEEYNYQDFVNHEWSKIIDVSGDSIRLEIKNYKRIPQLEKFSGRSKREFQDAAIDYFNEIVKQGDWHVSRVSKTNKLTVIFRKNKGEVVEVTGPLYHVTYQGAAEEILRNGLEPKESSNNQFLYPERIYLFTKYDENLFERFMIEKANINVSPESRLAGKLDTPPYSILKVRDVESYTFYKDKDIKNSVWTDQKIPTEKISLIKRVN